MKSWRKFRRLIVLFPDRRRKPQRFIVAVIPDGTFGHSDFGQLIVRLAAGRGPSRKRKSVLLCQRTVGGARGDLIRGGHAQ